MSENTSREARLYRRILRRETHSSRAALAVTLAVIITIALAYVGVEFVLRLLGQAPLLAPPAQLASGVTSASDYPAAALIGGGIVGAVVGLLLIILALSSGARSRHVLPSERAAVVVDDEVIASALARHAATAAGSAPDNTVVSVGRRTAVVRLVPTSGTPVDRSAVSATLEQELRSYELTPGIRSRVSVAADGKVGA